MGHNMKAPPSTWRNPVLAAGIAGALLVLGVLIFDLYRYNDYGQADCSVDRYAIAIQMKGSFEEHPYRRSAPYFMRIRISPKPTNSRAVSGIELLDLSLASLKTGRIVDLPKPSRHLHDEGVVYLVQPIGAAYEEYEVSGALASDGDQVGGDVKFHCRLNRDYRQELRVSFWDRLLSA